ncbi:DUF6415 family natural product biosynthesis protein [Streptomyces sp. NL15-2K]|uniref:DUF6415 family natural product biosynthesis protein n=1 Tax=Streptomyces sp. NL15-2K TaxID=376149 RepID=UPI000FF9F22B|nr:MULTISPECIES: DUF6415 family natural product biosynthesis protein [Actinomycetes]WKX09013.1 DUF6415 family natural product biosynthesis protein [Kutzneria buriramensis]GCB49490.1 hypothetical protein SNL152K_6829 [Streptomyces sp. NL15-2K]
MIPLGHTFDAVRLPERIVHAGAGTDDPDIVRAYLAQYLNGPVIHDLGFARYYALVPPGSAKQWRAKVVECLGEGTYLGVPRTDRTEQTRASYWVVPPARPGGLCRAGDALAVVIAGNYLADDEDDGSMTGPATNALPLDITTMHADAERLLARGPEPLSDEELETVRLRLRGYIQLLIPEVEQSVSPLPWGDSRREHALTCAGEARMRLWLGPGNTLPVRYSVLHRLARSVLALCDCLPGEDES